MNASKVDIRAFLFKLSTKAKLLSNRKHVPQNKLLIIIVRIGNKLNIYIFFFYHVNIYLYSNTQLEDNVADGMKLGKKIQSSSQK